MLLYVVDLETAIRLAFCQWILHCWSCTVLYGKLCFEMLSTTTGHAEEVPSLHEYCLNYRNYCMMSSFKFMHTE